MSGYHLGYAYNSMSAPILSLLFHLQEEHTYDNPDNICNQYKSVEQSVIYTIVLGSI
jgi:hypothetical protein